ncbi:uncharacterized protein [Aristolochia californica]|uniref:uncharacterized protein n=1 Tax=Aristolochia californica TaxID=171875 RepID=UPI0035E32CEB
MHRSASTSRASDEFFLNVSPQIKASPGLKPAEIDQLPTYVPLSDVSKESSRLRASENAVHVIPLVLILCAIILWFFSSPGQGQGEASFQEEAADLRYSYLVHEGRLLFPV